MFKLRLIAIHLILLFVSFSAFSMVYDNRFLPLYKRPYSRKLDKPSRAGFDFFAMAADSAEGEHDECVLIPRIFGVYDQGNLGHAISCLGCPNPLRDELQNVKNLIWTIDGKIKAQGVSLVYDQAIGKYFYFGASCLFMSTHSTHSFIFDRTESGLKVGEDSYSDIYDAMYKMHDMIGIRKANAHQIGFGDIDCYLRVGNIWDFLYTFRRIDAGLSLGCFIPTGNTTCVDSPASIPFGGNGHWGFYVNTDLEVEFKEDMKLSFLFQLIKRKSKVVPKRVPLAKEHPLYGALATKVDVDPGMTFVFSPLFSWENMRGGLGLSAGYTLVYHKPDCWTDIRPKAQKDCCPINLENLNCITSWKADYVNLCAFYDFGSLKTRRSLDPVVTLSWDVPSFLFSGRNVPKTHRICLAFDVNF